ncbi:MAG TPA: hypothetical protein VF846_01295 [Thermoanaerobaculia bacterium]|jgi:DNA-binding response OmpR family regulator
MAVAPKTALIIEDDVVYQELYADVLRRSHWASEVAADLKGAREFLARRRFDAYIIDLLLPGGSAGEVVQVVLAGDPAARAKSVIVSGLGSVARTVANGITVVDKASMAEIADFLARFSEGTLTE